MSSYLDNGKSIILDCVLTDTARFRLASGDVAKLKITKFALADDEINYGRYQKNHASGSAWRDLEILQTPVLEAFTNNASSMKYKLISVIENNLMYMPQLLLNEKGQQAGGMNTQTFLNANNGGGGEAHVTSPAVKGIYMVTADLATEDKLGNKNFGILFGASGQGKCIIRIDQGINTETINELSPSSPLIQRFPDLYEGAYTIQMPHHLVQLIDQNYNSITPSFIDDDQIALYTVASNIHSGGSGALAAVGTFVRENGCIDDGTVTGDCASGEVHKGPRGSILEFLLRTTQDVQSSTYFFERYGNTFDGLKSGGGVSGTYYYIDHNIKITGLNTGVSIDVPIRIIKYKEDA